jgi:hypothetical protein
MKHPSEYEWELIPYSFKLFRDYRSDKETGSLMVHYVRRVSMLIHEWVSSLFTFIRRAL